MARHGIFVSEQATQTGTPVIAKVSVPFVIGTAPIHSAQSPAAPGEPALCTSLSEAKAKLGYSDDWEKYTLCEFMDSHFSLYGCQPVIFCNILDPVTMKTALAAADMDVSEHSIKLPIDAINDATLIIGASGGSGAAYIKDTDYAPFYSGENLIIELLEGGSAYGAAQLSVAYSTVKPDSVTPNMIAAGLESIEQCMTLGTIPNIICAPGFSHNSTVAAVMATKAEGINGLFRAKTLIDIDANNYSDAIAAKVANNFTDLNQILCWPMLSLGGKKYHMSTQLAGLMAVVDAGNGGSPHESPSNKPFKADSLVLRDGIPVKHSKAQADMLNGSGIVTGLSFLGRLTAWGNYTACYPVSTDVKDYFIPVSRMYDFMGNTIIYTFWGSIDKPMIPRLVNSIVDTVNIWLNGLTGAGRIYGGRAEYIPAENSITDLLAGKIRIHTYSAPPSPMQEAEFSVEYDVSYIIKTLGA